jgi:hypothetical protein
MKRLFIHNTIFRICAPAIYGVVVYLLILLVNNNLNDLLKIYSNRELYVCIALSYLSLESLRGAIVLFAQWLAKWPRKYRTFIQTFVSLSVSLMIVYAGVDAYFRWVEGYSVNWLELRIFLVIFGFTALLYNILYFSNEFLLLENTQEINTEARLREKVEADFANFRQEINPGFLYESLESILQSLQVDLDGAEDQVDRLASIYRYQLMNRDKELVSFTDELQALQSLVALLNYRYHQQIRLSVNVQATSVHLVPGSLLMTVDAIVRNTLFSKEVPFLLSIYEEDDDYIVLQHKMNDKLILHEESMQAFARIQRVYSFFSESHFMQVKAHGENYIKFPALKISEESIAANRG